MRYTLMSDEFEEKKEIIHGNIKENADKIFMQSAMRRFDTLQSDERQNADEILKNDADLNAQEKNEIFSDEQQNNVTNADERKIEGNADEQQNIAVVTEEKIFEEPQVQIIQPEKIKYVLEALLFVSGNSISTERLKKLLTIDLDSLRKNIFELNNEYKSTNRCFKIAEVADGFQLVTRPEFAPYIRKFFGSRKIKHIPPSALETLAIVAYQQPITKAKIEHIRGVNTDMQLQTLIEKKLVEITGRAEELGRPLLYGTTKSFLEYFGLRDLSELPNSRELDQIIAEHKEEETKKVGKILNEIDGITNETTGAENDGQSAEELSESEAMMRERFENEELKKEEDEELEKEFVHILQNEKKIRKKTRETFEKLASPEEFQNLINDQKNKIEQENQIVQENKILEEKKSEEKIISEHESNNEQNKSLEKSINSKAE